MSEVHKVILLSPGQIMLRMCQDFLDIYPEGEERTTRLDQIAELINNQHGMDTPYPTTANKLKWKIDGLLDAAGKNEKAQDWLSDEIDEEDWNDAGFSLEEFAFSMED